MRQLWESWTTRAFGSLGVLFVAGVLCGCTPDTTKPPEPQVSPDEQADPNASTASEEITEEIVTIPEEAIGTEEGPEATAGGEVKTGAPVDPLDTSDTGAAVKLGEPDDPVNLKD